MGWLGGWGVWVYRANEPFPFPLRTAVCVCPTLRAYSHPCHRLNHARRYVYLAVDASAAMREMDLKPERLRHVLKVRTVCRWVDMYMVVVGSGCQAVIVGSLAAAHAFISIRPQHPPHQHQTAVAGVRQGVLRPEPHLPVGAYPFFSMPVVHTQHKHTKPRISTPQKPNPKQPRVSS